MLVARLVAASVGVETVPTEVIGNPSVFTVVPVEGDQFAIRFTPKCACSGKSRPEGRITSSQGVRRRSFPVPRQAISAGEKFGPREVFAGT